MGSYPVAVCAAALLLAGPCGEQGRTAQESFVSDCGGASVILAETGGKKFDLVRACEIYRDLIRHHLPQTAERPNVLFHVVEKLDCRDTDLSASLGSQVVACENRTRRATEIFLLDDRPEHYILALVDGLDYANRLYLRAAHVRLEASRVLAELKNPNLRKRYHATVDAHELKK